MGPGFARDGSMSRSRRAMAREDVPGVEAGTAEVRETGEGGPGLGAALDQDPATGRAERVSRSRSQEEGSKLIDISIKVKYWTI